MLRVVFATFITIALTAAGLSVPFDQEALPKLIFLLVSISYIGLIPIALFCIAIARVNKQRLTPTRLWIMGALVAGLWLTIFLIVHFTISGPQMRWPGQLLVSALSCAAGVTYLWRSGLQQQARAPWWLGAAHASLLVLASIPLLIILMFSLMGPPCDADSEDCGGTDYSLFGRFRAGLMHVGNEYPWVFVLLVALLHLTFSKHERRYKLSYLAVITMATIACIYFVK